MLERNFKAALGVGKVLSDTSGFTRIIVEESHKTNVVLLSDTHQVRELISILENVGASSTLQKDVQLAERIIDIIETVDDQTDALCALEYALRYMLAVGFKLSATNELLDDMVGRLKVEVPELAGDLEIDE